MKKMKKIIKKNFFLHWLGAFVDLLTYADISAVLDPFSDCLSWEAHPWQVQVVSGLWLSLATEDDELRCRGGVQHSEDVAGLVEVNHGKEEVVIELGRVAPGLGDYLVLVVGRLADLAFTVRVQRSQHDHHCVVARRRLDILLEFVEVKTDHWPF